MGLNRQQIYIIYFVETLAIVLVSMFLGTCVGVMISIAGEVYYIIFFELPFEFFFPYTEFFMLLSFCFVTSIGTTYFGIKDIIHLPITRTLKGLV